MFIIDCDTENGGMQLNNDFCVDFGEEPDGPSLAHEVNKYGWKMSIFLIPTLPKKQEKNYNSPISSQVRYPGGDCTSDIYVADMDKIAKM